MSPNMYNFAKKIAYAAPPLLFCHRQAATLYCKVIAIFYKVTVRTNKVVVSLVLSKQKTMYPDIKASELAIYEKKKIIDDLLHDKHIAILLKSSFTETNEWEQYLNSLPLEILSDRALILAELEKLQIKKVKRSLDTRKKTIAIHFASAAFRENIGNIAGKLRDKGYNVFFIIGTICNDEREKEPWVCYLSTKNSIKTLNFVDVFISVTLCDDFPEQGKKVIFIHDIHDSPLSDLNNFRRLGLLYNYFVLASEYMASRMRDIFSTGEDENKGICLLKAGYIKLDQNLSRLKAIGTSKKALIYAPTCTGLVFDDLISLSQHGEDIINAMLENFPEYDIIFRPHPLSKSTGEIKNIIQRFLGNPRFIYDDNASQYMDSYAKSVLMVSDMSGTAFTYAFTTLRSVVFFSHNEKEVVKRLGDYRTIQDRAKVGYVAENVVEMVEKIQILLATGDEFSTKIKNYRDSIIYNVGKSEDYFVNNFEYIIENKRHPDWEYI